MFSYAFSKILKTQFNLGPRYLDDSISSFNGLSLTWYYYGYSRTYGLVIAGAQIAAALLLLFRKTERIGVILFLSFMINILLLNYFYEIDGAKSMSITLTIMGIFLLFSDWKAFKNYFLKSNINQPLIPSIIPAKAKNLYWLKFLVIILLAFFAHRRISDLKKEYLVESKLHGVWEITPRNSKNKIDKLYIGYYNRIKLRDSLNNMYRGKLELDTIKKIGTFKASYYSEKYYYFIEDSIAKLDVQKDSLKKIRANIREFYNTKNNSSPIEFTFNYKLRGDTLILNGQREVKYLNITDRYKN
ncbi:hypothetical protein [Dokdonia sp.]|uniref:hypothetical protein n=1 Tax=Dokdonia sp. TaxID=2024995 RepID=UPI003262E1CB